MKTMGSRFSEGSLLRLAGGAALGLVLALGYSTPANAQYGDYRDNHESRRLSQTDMRRVAQINGYSDGFERGVLDRRNHDRFSFQTKEEYRRAMAGFDTGWNGGWSRDYQSAYRTGFGQGYSDGFYGRSRNRTYDRSRVSIYYGTNPYDPYSSYPGYTTSPYGTYPRYGNYGDKSPQEVANVAAQYGYTEGFQRGQYDAANGNRPNPQGHGAYQFAMDGFVQDWGNASVYQSTYRQYFIQGYEAGFNRRDYDRRYYRRP
jgi:hypothetical protein